MADKFMESNGVESGYFAKRQKQFMDGISSGIKNVTGGTGTRKAAPKKTAKKPTETANPVKKSQKTTQSVKKVSKTVTKPQATPKAKAAPKAAPKAETVRKGPKDLSKLPVGLANYWRKQNGEKEVK